MALSKYTLEDWEDGVEVPLWLYCQIERSSDGEMLDDNGPDYVDAYLENHFEVTSEPIYEELGWGIYSVDEDPDLGVSDDNWACGTLEVD